MEWFAIIIPILIMVLGLLFFSHKLVLWEIGLPVLASIVAIFVLKWSMVTYLTSDTEYLSEYVVEARYYEPWNEYHHRTCTRSCGKNCTTTYDCSYVEYHSEYWEIVMNTGNTYNISEYEFNRLKGLFKNQEFVEMDRDYHTIDGDMYTSLFDGDFNHIQPRTYSESYENKTQACHTLFRFEDLDSTKMRGLYEYPEIYDGFQKSCLNCSKEHDLILRRYNGFLGEQEQIKIFVLMFKNHDVEIAERQRQFWKNGNKNELVICVDSKFRWCRTFSWCDNKEVEVKSNDIFTRKISMNKKLELLEANIHKNWKRKDFSDFSYISVPLSGIQMVWLYIIVTLISVGMLLIGVLNDKNPNR